MSVYKVTACYADGVITYTAIGKRNALMDAAYDSGAIGVACILKKPCTR